MANKLQFQKKNSKTDPFLQDLLMQEFFSKYIMKINK